MVVAGVGSNKVEFGQHPGDFASPSDWSVAGPFFMFAKGSIQRRKRLSRTLGDPAKACRRLVIAGDLAVAFAVATAPSADLVAFQVLRVWKVN